MQLSEVSIALCDFEYIDEHSQPIPHGRRASDDMLGEWVRIPSVRSGKAELLMHMCCGTMWVTMNSILFRRSLLDRVGLFATQFGSFGDVDWTLRVSLATDIAWVPKTLASFRRHRNQATPNEMIPSHWSLLMRIQRNVIHDKLSGIPALWKNLPHWEDQLLAYCRSKYLCSLKLHRWEARRNPRAFFAHCLDAAIKEPRWLMGRLLQGFGASTDDKIDRGVHARQLIRFFNASWPPQHHDSSW
jgi:GT2 family glycosyltransferase